MDNTPKTRAKATRKALKAIAELLVDAIRVGMATEGLKDSDLDKSLETSIRGGDTVVVYMAVYGQWVISGRRKFVRKVPIAALLTWIKKNNIQPIPVNGKTISINSLAFAIQTAIFKNGIRPRDFVGPALTDEFFSIAEEMIFDALEAAFNEVLKFV